MAGIDPGILERIELGRVPLKYGAAEKLLSVYNINPCWLATGVGPMAVGVSLPQSIRLGVSDSSSFSEVFKEKLEKALTSRVAKIEASPRYKFGELTHSADPKGRVIAEEFLSSELRSWLEHVPSKHLNKLVNSIRFAARGLLDDWEGEPDPPATVQKRREQMQRERNAIAERRAHLKSFQFALTDINASVKQSEVKARWPLLKKRLQRETAAPGGKSRLAKFLKVKSVASVSQWLTDSENAREPGAETALQMLYWLEHPEER